MFTIDDKISLWSMMEEKSHCELIDLSITKSNGTGSSDMWFDISWSPLHQYQCISWHLVERKGLHMNLGHSLIAFFCFSLFYASEKMCQSRHIYRHIIFPLIMESSISVSFTILLDTDKLLFHAVYLWPSPEIDKPFPVWNRFMWFFVCLLLLLLRDCNNNIV